MMNGFLLRDGSKHNKLSQVYLTHHPIVKKLPAMTIDQSNKQDFDAHGKEGLSRNEEEHAARIVMQTMGGAETMIRSLQGRCET